MNWVKTPLVPHPITGLALVIWAFSRPGLHPVLKGLRDYALPARCVDPSPARRRISNPSAPEVEIAILNPRLYQSDWRILLGTILLIAACILTSDSHPYLYPFAVQCVVFYDYYQRLVKRSTRRAALEQRYPFLKSCSPSSPDGFLPSFPPPLTPGFCWVGAFIPGVDIKNPPPALRTKLLQWFGPESPWNYLFNGWITTKELLIYMDEFQRDSITIACIQPGYYHIHTGPGGVPVSRAYVASLPPAWFGLTPDFFSDSALRTAALGMHIGDYARELATARHCAPYAVAEKQMHHLITAGIQPPPPGALRHKHPIHYALRNQNRQKASMLLAGQRWYGLWVSDSSRDYLKHTPGVADPVDRFNPRWEAKDITRYKGTAAPASSAPSSIAPVWFADDALHHLSPSTVGSWFDLHPTLRCVVATIVVPPETAFGFPALTPDLYNFERRGENLIYIPENDDGGHYVQPYDAHKWLTASRLITPDSECLHVGMIHQQYAHALIVISRPELIVEKYRVMDMPKLTEIAWYAHPTSKRFERLTTTSLLHSLVSYAARVSATNQRDLYSKVAAHASSTYGQTNQTQIRAAVMHATASRMIDFRISPSRWDTFCLRISYYISLPLYTWSWLMHSVNSRFFGARYDVPNIWDVETKHLVSHPSDSTLPGLLAPVCNARDVPFWYVPPSATTAARLAVFNSTAVLWVLVKLMFLLAYKTFHIWFPRVPWLANHITYILNLSWHETPVGLCFLLIGVWLGLRGPRLRFYPFHLPVWAFLRRAYACLFFLPCAGLRVPAGASTFYQLVFMFAFLFHEWPRMWPPYYFHEKIATRANILVHFRATFWSAIGILIVTAIIVAWANPRRDLPHHCHVHDDPEPASPTYRDSDPSPGPSPPHSTPPTPPPKIPTPPPPAPPRANITPPPRIPTPLRPGRRYVPAQAVNIPLQLIPRPAAPVQPARPVTPVPPRDPLQRFKHLPSGFDLNTFRRLLTDPPPMAPQAGFDCVWDCLGTALGMLPATLFCNWMSFQTAQYRINFGNGAVPRSDLNLVFSHFGLGVTMREAVYNADNCPRGAAQPPRPPVYSARQMPILEQPPVPGWPVAQFFLTSTPNGLYHLTDHANCSANAPTVAAPAHAMVGYISRQVPRVEIADVLNVPIKTWNQAYARLEGSLLNAAAALHAGFNNIQQYRAAYQPLPARPVVPHSFVYNLTLQDVTLARHLSQDLKNNPDAMDLRGMGADQIARGLDTLCKLAETHIRTGTYNRPPVNFHILAGVGGSGKSTALARFLPTIAPAGGYSCSNLRFHTWFNKLRAPLEAALSPLFPGLQSFNFSTGCMCLAQPLTGTLILDDATMLWPGFIPLLVASNPGITDLVITCDTTQGRLAFPASDSVCRDDVSTSEWLRNLSPDYATIVRRYSQDICDLWGLPYIAPEPGQPVRQGRVFMTSQAPHNVPLLVVSPRFAETQNSGGQRCLTFAACQGLTIEGDCAIDLGGLTSTATDENVWTALTRPTGNIFLVMGATMGSSPRLVESLYGKSQILSAILAVASRNQCAEITAANDPDHLIARAVHNHLARNLSAAACAQLGLPVATPIVGALPARFRSVWLETPRNDGGDYYTARTTRGTLTKPTTSAPAFSSHKDPLLHSHHESIREMLRLYVPVTNDMNLRPDGTGYKLPMLPDVQGEFDPIFNHDTFVDPDVREKVAPGTELVTAQHVEDGPNAVLRHHASDKATQIISERKRIVLGKDSSDLSSLDKARLKQLKRGFAKFFDVDSWNSAPFDEALFDQCSRDFLSPWVSKRTLAGIANSVRKDNIDQAPNYTELFLKTQYVKKEEKRFAAATAGQIVSEFPLTKQFRDAPFALFVERLSMKHAYPSTYLHCRASPDDMSRWYRKHWSQGPITTNDYTSWDQGCDKVFANFAAWVMRLCRVPDEYVQTYLFERLNTFSYLGPHRTKQESGDRWTWLINTLGNAAITGASLNCPKRTTAAFSGDDGAVLGSWRYQPGFHAKQWKMVPKRLIEYESVFCGYHIGGEDIYIDPIVVMHRAQNGLALGRNDPEYWNSISDALRELGPRVSDHDQHVRATQHYLEFARRTFNI